MQTSSAPEKPRRLAARPARFPRLPLQYPFFLFATVTFYRRKVRVVNYFREAAAFEFSIQRSNFKIRPFWGRYWPQPGRSASKESRICLTRLARTKIHIKKTKKFKNILDKFWWPV
jgi:hypothetical protein